VVDRARAVPAWGWLAALVACSTLVRFLFARHMVGPWIMIDEIVYSELAKSFAATGHFAIREAPTSGYGIVYPILISPAYALFRAIPAVYTAIKVINSFLMSLAAVPAYLLARRAVSSRGALVVAVLTVAVPSTFYAGTVMTENGFYPIFLFVAWALVVALERPRLVSVLVFLALVAVAYETRAQAVAILPAALTAPVVMAALARRPRLVLEHRLLYAIVAGGALLVVAAEAVRGRSPRSLLGAYAAATSSTYTVGSTARWFLWHLSELTLYVGFVPFLAVVLLCVRGPSLAAAERAVVAATVCLVAWLGVEVAAFASQPSVVRIEERNLFYVAPLLFTCLVLWIERGLPRPRIALAAGAIAVVALAAAVPYQRFLDTSATSDTFGVLALWSLALKLSIHAEDVRWVVAGLAAVFCLVAALLPRRLWPVLPALVFALYLVAAQPIDARTKKASIGAVFQGITRPDRDWITAIIGSRDPTRVSVVWTGRTDRLTVNENEFFNRAVGTIYTTNGPVPGGLAQTPITLDRADGRFTAAGRPVAVADLLSDTSEPWAGRLIGADPKKALVLLRVDGPLRLRYLTDGIYDDSWSGAHALYRGFDCGGGTLSVLLGSDPKLYADDQHVSASVAGSVVARIAVPPARTVVMRVPLHGACVVHFTVARTKVPGPGDRRHLGVRFLGFTTS
jgi:hypothetical protein